MQDGVLSGKSALVIGGSSGIGQSIAEALGAAGARLTLVARRREKLDWAAALLRDAGTEAAVAACDVTDTAALTDTIHTIAGGPDGLDILVNSQGTTVIQPAAEFTPADYDRVMDTNLKSLFFSCLAVREPMRRRGGGAIINIASLAAHRGWPGSSVYALSKHGVLALTRSLAAEWAADGIRVNSISPGFFLTELNRDRMSADRKAHALARTPMNRFGEVAELRSAALFLAAPESGFVTGADVPVDGGYLAAGI